MYSNIEEQRKVETEVLEDFICNYEDYKKYLATAPTEEKQTPQYQHRISIVEAIDRLYPTLDEDMQQIFDMRYRQGIKDFADIADEIYLKVTRVKRMRDWIVKQFGIAIGWYA